MIVALNLDMRMPTRPAWNMYVLKNSKKTTMTANRMHTSWILPQGITEDKDVLSDKLICHLKNINSVTNKANTFVNWLENFCSTAYSKVNSGSKQSNLRDIWLKSVMVLKVYSFQMFFKSRHTISYTVCTRKLQIITA